MDNNLRQVVSDFKAYLKQEKKKGLQSVPKSARQDTTMPNSSTKVAAIGSKAETLEQLFQQFADCRKCSLGQTRKKLVFGEGDPQARLMFIGEGPGFDEDQTGRPFIGKAGQLLTKAIETTINLSREEVYIGNIVNATP